MTAACVACSGAGVTSPDASEPGDAGSASDASGADAGVFDAAAGDPYCPVVGYNACGGDVIGTWAYRSLCPDDPEAAAALCEHPYDDRPECTGTGNEAICDGTTSGTLTFNADGTLAVDTQISLVTTWNFTDACLAAAPTTGSTAEERCASMANEHLTCAYTSQCICVSDPMVEGDSSTATYAIDGQEITLGEDPPASYCVDGDLLTMDYYLYHPVSWRYWVLERQ